MEFLLVLVVFGVICYLVNTYIPMAPIFKSVFNIIVALIVIVYLMNFLGFDTGLHFGRSHLR